MSPAVDLISLDGDIEVVVVGGAIPAGARRTVETTKEGTAALWNVGVAHASAARLAFVGFDGSWTGGKRQPQSFSELVVGPILEPSAFVLERGAILAAGGFDERLSHAHQHLVLRLAAAGVRVDVALGAQAYDETVETLTAAVVLHDDLARRLPEPFRRGVAARARADRNRLAAALRARAKQRDDPAAAALDVRAAVRVRPLDPLTLLMLAGAPRSHLRSAAHRVLRR